MVRGGRRRRGREGGRDGEEREEEREGGRDGEGREEEREVEKREGQGAVSTLGCTGYHWSR